MCFPSVRRGRGAKASTGRQPGVARYARKLAPVNANVGLKTYENRRQTNSIC
jgi:hypothetical protein